MDNDPSIIPKGLGELHPLRQIPGKIGGVLIHFSHLADKDRGAEAMLSQEQDDAARIIPKV